MLEFYNGAKGCINIAFLRNREIYNNVECICQALIWTHDQVSQFLVVYCLLFSTKIRSFISVLCPKQLVITRRLWSAGWQQLEGQNVFAIQCCALHKFHMTEGQHMLDQITSGRMSKCVWLKCVLCIPYILSGSPNECCLHPHDECIITTWRLGWRAPLVARNYFAKFLSAFLLIWEIYNLSVTSVICSKWF